MVLQTASIEVYKIPYEKWLEVMVDIAWHKLLFRPFNFYKEGQDDYEWINYCKLKNLQDSIERRKGL